MKKWFVYWFIIIGAASCGEDSQSESQDYQETCDDESNCVDGGPFDSSISVDSNNNREETPTESQDAEIRQIEDIDDFRVAATGTIDSKGGAVEVADPKSPAYGARVEVPQNAVDQEVVFEIRLGSLLKSPPLLPIAQQVMSPMLSFWSSQPFHRDVTICLPVSDVERDSYNLYTIDEDETDWSLASKTVDIDKPNHMACSAVSHFSDKVVTADDVCHLPGSFMFKPGVNPSCRDKMRLEVYLMSHRSTIFSGIRQYSTDISEEEQAIQLLNAMNEIAANIVTLVDLPGMSVKALDKTIGSKSLTLLNKIYGDELGGEIAQLAYQIGAAVLLGGAPPHIYFAERTMKAGFNFISAFRISELNERVNEFLIADEFLMEYSIPMLVTIVYLETVWA